MPYKLLLADNNLDFLDTTAELLRAYDYDVFAVNTPTAARQILVDQHIDAAILDIRLLDDSDERDVSGLNLAREMQMLAWGVYVPKIMLTQVKSFEYAREVLRPSRQKPPVAFDYVTKQEGFPTLLEAIEQAIAIDPVRLRRLIANHFNEGELRDLCFDLRHIRYDDLPGQGNGDKARELVDYFERRGLLRQLWQAMCKRRPNLLRRVQGR